jgi:glutaminyl-peptide cyclotransferase
MSPVRMPPMIVAVAVIGALTLGCGSGAANPSAGAANPSAGAAARLQADRFDANRAWRIVERQLAYGQRPAGSPQLRRLARTLRSLLPDGRFESLAGERGLRNVVGTLPGRRPGIVIGAHYDTLVKPSGFIGANNGAAGTAIVIEAARALSRGPRAADAREVRFVLFDGEEPAAGLPEESSDFSHEGLRGSRAYVERHRGRTAAMILLDYVGNRGLRLPREGSSTAALWVRLRAAAGKVGAGGFFPDGTGATIVDDHTPFLRAGVPAVDLIDWSYPGHELSDRLDQLSRRSLDAVGETVVELATGLRAAR